jgi:type IV secretory pathway VirB10-like protein
VTWVIVVLLVFCFPVGLILVWTNHRFTQRSKIVITGVVVALVAVGAIASAASPPKETVKSGDVATTTTEATTTSAPAPTTTKRPTTTPPPTTAKPPATTKPAPPVTTAPPATAPPVTAPPAPAMTPAQEQAVRSAQSYLEFSSFSRQGLIDQLSSEYGDQFSVQDATVAVDSLNVDWNAQAVKSAKEYLSTSSFSCQGLIDQLSSPYGSEFTVEQATYGANQAGIC